MAFQNPLIRLIRNLKGNQRAGVYTELLLGIPHSIFATFLPLYMSALGITDSRIAFLTITFTSALEIVWCLFSGAITDKLGRIKTISIFEFVSWCIPCLIWAISQNYTFFFVAALFSGSMEVIHDASYCALVEDEDTDNLLGVFTLLDIETLLAGFVVGIIGFFVDKFTLVPTMRVVFVVLFAMVLLKVKLYHKMAHESDFGKRKIIESKDKSILKLTFDGLMNFVKSLSNKQLILYLIFAAVLNSVMHISESFLPLFLSSGYGIDDGYYAKIVLLRSICTFLAFAFIVPYFKTGSLKLPLTGAIALHIVGIATLLIGSIIKINMIFPVIISAVCEGIFVASLLPIRDVILSHTVSPENRAESTGFLQALVLIINLPLGFAAGSLAKSNRMYVMMMVLALTVVLLMVAMILIKVFRERNFNKN